MLLFIHFRGSPGWKLFSNCQQGQRPIYWSHLGCFSSRFKLVLAIYIGGLQSLHFDDLELLRNSAPKISAEAGEVVVRNQLANDLGELLPLAIRLGQETVTLAKFDPFFFWYLH
jgi:hypothetical protein